MCGCDFDTVKGAENYLSTDLDGLEEVSTVEALLFGFHFWNTNGSTAFVQIFDAASDGDVTLGTTVPVMSFAVPASGGYDIPPSRIPLRRFQNGIVVAATTAATGDTEVTTGLLANIFYYND